MGMLRELVAFCMGASLMLPAWMQKSRPEMVAKSFVALPEPCPAPPPEASLEAFIEQLENLTVRQTWTAQVLGQVKFYRERKEDFGNKADFTTASHVMRWYDQDGRCGSERSALVLLGGCKQGPFHVQRAAGLSQGSDAHLRDPRKALPGASQALQGLRAWSRCTTRAGRTVCN